MNPIPPDMNIQEQWRRHDVFTDKMVEYFKKSIGCSPHHGVIDVPRRKFVSQFKKDFPEKKVCWLKIDQRNGALNVYQDNLVFTDWNGSKPMVVKDLYAETLEFVPLEA